MAKPKEKGNGEGTIFVAGSTGRYVGQYFYKGKRKAIYQRKNEGNREFKARFNKIIASINERVLH